MTSRLVNRLVVALDIEQDDAEEQLVEQVEALVKQAGEETVLAGDEDIAEDIEYLRKLLDGKKHFPRDDAQVKQLQRTVYRVANETSEVLFGASDLASYCASVVILCSAVCTKDVAFFVTKRVKRKLERATPQAAPQAKEAAEDEKKSAKPSINYEEKIKQLKEILYS